MHLFDRDAKPHPTWRLIVIAVFMLTIGAMSINGLVYAMSKQVSIKDDNGYFEEFTTYKATTAQVLEEKNIIIGKFDEVNYGLDETIHDGAQVIISRAVYVYIVNGEDEELILTAKKTAGEVLESLNIDVGPNTILNVPLEEKVFKGMTLRIVYSKEETLTTEEIIPFKVVKKPSSKLKEGETRVVREGSEGLVQRVYTVFYENNRETLRQLVEENVITQAVDKIIEYGMPSAPKTAVVYHSGTVVSRGAELRYKGVVTCSASAYSIKGTTATGRRTQPGVVAVDPKVIPLGSRLYIEAADGSWTYGTAIAADTGGAIKGNKVDLYMESYSEAIRFGRRQAKVYILE